MGGGYDCQACIALSRMPQSLVSDLAISPALRFPVSCAGMSWHRCTVDSSLGSRPTARLHEAGMPSALGIDVFAPAHRSQGTLHEQAYQPVQQLQAQLAALTGQAPDRAGTKTSANASHRVVAAGHLTHVMELIRRRARARFELELFTEAVHNQVA